MKIGKFGISDCDNERYAIGFNENEYTEFTLHCGDYFEIEIQGKWVLVHIEYDNCWYLIDENENKIDIPLMATKARV